MSVEPQVAPESKFGLTAPELLSEDFGGFVV